MNKSIRDNTEEEAPFQRFHRVRPVPCSDRHVGECERCQRPPLREARGRQVTLLIREGGHAPFLVGRGIWDKDNSDDDSPITPHWRRDAVSIGNNGVTMIRSSTRRLTPASHAHRERKRHHERRSQTLRLQGNPGKSHPVTCSSPPPPAYSVETYGKSLDWIRPIAYLRCWFSRVAPNYSADQDVTFGRYVPAATNARIPGQGGRYPHG